MKSHTFVRSLSTSVALLLGLTSPAVAQSRDSGHRSGRYTVVFRAGSLPADAAARVAAAGGTLQKRVDQIGVLTASGDAAFAARLAGDAAVLAVGPEKFYTQPKVRVGGSEPEAIGSPTAADNLYSLQWGIRRVGAPAMWAQVPLEIQNTVTVAVLDTGVMHTHLDLAPAVVRSIATNYCVEAGLGAFPIYSKLIDFDAHPVWTPSMGCDPASTYYVAHGTHVAGTVAASFGAGRVVGVAPGVRIAAYKVFDRFRFTLPDSTVIDDVGAFDGPVFTAIVDSALRGDAVINMSLGGTIDRSNPDDNASWLAWDRVAKFANQRGTVLITAAGNEEENSNGTLAHVPSDLPTVISTTATGTSSLVVSGGLLQAAPGSDVLAFYSNYGAATDVSAPGGDCGPGFPATCVSQYFILSTYIFETGPSAGAPGYAFFAGTSMASPHVAAVAAIVKALHPGWSPGAIRAHLKSTAEAIGSHQLFGHGIVRADGASK
jgi:subtilisin family serine protease